MLPLLTILPVAASPIVSPPRGVYDAALVVVVSPEAPTGAVRCGVNRPPDAPCPPTFTIDTTTLLYVEEVDADGTIGPTVVHSYLFPAAVAAAMPATAGHPVYGPSVDATLRALPSISLAGGLSVVSDAEVPVSFEWIDPAGDDVQVQCGANQTGGTSPAYPKDSYRVHFRSAYGASRLEIDLYDDEPGVLPADSFDAISFRSNNHDSVFYLGVSGQYLRNPFMDESHLAMGHLAPHGRPAHLYLDGVYWGLYHVREHFSAAFMANYLGGSEDDFEAVNAGIIEDGTGVGWSRVVAAGRDWEAFSAVVDEAQFLDYMIFNFYAANAWDWWSNHNWMAAGPSAGDPRAGQWIFHSSDNDICLYYDWTTDITTNGGPADLFATLRAQGHPDFWSLFQDRAHALLGDRGPLAADVARARYAGLADESFDAVVAESGVWGAGWWDRDDEWVTERARLLDGWFPYRTSEVLRQFRARGWYPLDGPSIDTEAGVVPAGAVVTFAAPAGAQVYYSVDGSDPRRSGGAVSGSAVGPVDAGSIVVDAPTTLIVRTRAGDTWGPGVTRTFEVDEAPPLVLNEWNAVAPDELLDDDGEDDALGRIEGNGGDWIELLVLEDGLDLRGWTIEMTDRRGSAGVLRLGDAPELADLPAGLILTIAEDLPEDLAWDPEVGDWRMHLRAGDDGPGAAVSAVAFDVTSYDWTLVMRDRSGRPWVGPVGEGVSPARGIGGDEVGLLAVTPDGSVRRDSPHYTDGSWSTYGAPNVWDGGAQDLTALRGIVDGPLDTSWSSPDTAGADSAPTGGLPDPAPEDSAAADPVAGTTGCGCASTGSSGGWLVAAGVLALLRRRAALVLVAGCVEKPDGSDVVAPPTDSGTAPAPPPADTAPPPKDTAAAPVCHRDADGDGFGDPYVVVSCDDPGATGDDTDCDDLDGRRHPGAPETCDLEDDDCDGMFDEDPVDGLPFYVDGDGDGWGSEEIVLACANGTGTSLISGDCDDADPARHPEAVESCDDGDLDCDGVAGGLPGGGEGCPAASCLEALEARGSASDGAYWLELPSGTRAQVWCDMTTDGGGWTLGFVRCSGDTGSALDYGSFEQGLSALAGGPGAASSAASGCTGWLDLNALGWETLTVSAWSRGGEAYRSRGIPRSELRVRFGDDGYLLYGGSTGYYWCSGASSYTDWGVGAVNNPEGAPADCKGHGSLGTGWDFSESPSANAGLTQCGTDGSNWMYASWAGTLVYYGSPGGAHALWVR